VVVITLCAVHATIAHWRILRGPGKQVWLSLSAGAALAYVFTYLLPKLARIEDKILETESIIGHASSLTTPICSRSSVWLRLSPARNSRPMHW